MASRLDLVSGHQPAFHRGSGAIPGWAVAVAALEADRVGDRKSTRLNSSHSQISYAVFCLTKNTETICTTILDLPRSLASMVKPWEAAMERRPLTRNSRPITMTATHAGTMRGLN